ncbi:PerC family transcriptional regulator [Salmonella enterica]|uniref:PerC family transcriptional regulator n=2 Tax=Salmonella enterica TaxID=28901 RepID=A0A5U3G3F5_SALET|nr:hypothetical protein CHD70_25795 [Salmonella enterica]EBP4060915.1 PerC family transcriptional regulator [Salmonella enterica subsp. enterica]EDP2158373.1 PerC family transcriptional regulator [Salmonella enterica subsp. enterica serovar Kisarawe]EAS5877858.1 PerC family transcriptional regulator [Salmonella enterica]EAU6766609.1 PerC family transcriptional regulator [Salmonella enterica]
MPGISGCITMTERTPRRFSLGFRTPKEASPEYLKIQKTAEQLSEKGFYRRAAGVWKNAVFNRWLPENERNLCANNAAYCSGLANGCTKFETY